mmetsp:Transcript_29747/g.102848  ORF Transcript_29747/g.102848 Transcript_29747/m.102848 type:complete len:260 (-) Transcript_29747:1469-2248(-)
MVSVQRFPAAALARCQCNVHVAALDGPERFRAAGPPINLVARDLGGAGDFAHGDVEGERVHTIAELRGVDVLVKVPFSRLHLQFRRPSSGPVHGGGKVEELDAVRVPRRRRAEFKGVFESLSVQDCVELVHVKVPPPHSMRIQRHEALVVHRRRRPVGEHAERVVRVPLGAARPDADEHKPEARNEPRAAAHLARVARVDDAAQRGGLRRRARRRGGEQRHFNVRPGVAARVFVVRRGARRRRRRLWRDAEAAGFLRVS